MHPHIYSGRCQENMFDTYTDQKLPDTEQNGYMDAWKKYHKTACTCFREDEQLEVRNMTKTL
jgi:hypothetical protein